MIAFARLLVAAALAAACACPVSAGTVSPPAPAPGQFPHADFGAILARVVDAKGLVDYKALAADRAGLDRYLELVAAYSPKSHPKLFPTRQDQEAFYLDAYNALAMRGVIDRPGIKSVQDNLFDFFYATKYVIGGKKVSLYDLENKIVRKQFKDARVHFALNCQSGGCPRLPQEHFDPVRLDAQLDAFTAEFCANPAKVFVDPQGVVHASQIFEWYAADFKDAGGPIGFCNGHGASLPVGAKVETIPYDWSLSAQVGRGP